MILDYRVVRCCWLSGLAAAGCAIEPVRFASAELIGVPPPSKLESSPAPGPNAASKSDEPPAQAGTALNGGANKAAIELVSPNSLVLAAVRAMPSGGQYRANREAIDKLQEAIRVEHGSLRLNPAIAKPSFCSSATYLVFLSVVEKLHRSGRIQLNSAVLERLLVNNEPDGVGVWGRWNANGPGTAGLFHAAGLGINFTSLRDARPGDFLKIFWTDQIGAREFGHSVVYLGYTREGGPSIFYWSSNQSGGYGTARVPLSKIKRMVFSRFENPAGLARLARLPERDQYLAALLKKASSEKEMLRMVGAAPALTKTSAPLDR